MELSDEDLVKAYITCRDMVAEIERECDSRVEKYKTGMLKIASAMEARMLKSGHKSVRTSQGTAILTVKSVAMCHDWLAFDKYVVETNQPGLFQRKLNTSLVKDIHEQTGKLPPGVDIQMSQSLGFRKPTATASNQPTDTQPTT